MKMTIKRITTIEKEVDVKLVDDGDRIEVIVDGWAILSLISDGTMRRSRCISSDNGAGLQIDELGRVVLVNE